MVEIKVPSYTHDNNGERSSQPGDRAPNSQVVETHDGCVVCHTHRSLTIEFKSVHFSFPWLVSSLSFIGRKGEPQFGFYKNFFVQLLRPCLNGIGRCHHHSNSSMSFKISSRSSAARLRFRFVPFFAVLLISTIAPFACESNAISNARLRIAIRWICSSTVPTATSR